LEPESEDEMDRSPTVVRPDYGEALVNTVRVRRREPAPAESSFSAEQERRRENEEGSPNSEADAEAERYLARRSTANTDTEIVRSEEAAPAESAVVEGEDGQRTPAQSRRRRRGGRRHHRADREQAPPAEEPEKPAPRPTKDQLDLFGRRG
jgi:hypothetical protein